MYSTIINPDTGKKLSTSSHLGMNILQNYVKSMYGGADPAGDSPPSTLNNRAKLIDIEVSSDSDDEQVDSGLDSDSDSDSSWLDIDNMLREYKSQSPTSTSSRRLDHQASNFEFGDITVVDGVLLPPTIPKYEDTLSGREHVQHLSDMADAEEKLVSAGQKGQLLVQRWKQDGAEKEKINDTLRALEVDFTFMRSKIDTQANTIKELQRENTLISKDMIFNINTFLNTKVEEFLADVDADLEEDKLSGSSALAHASSIWEVRFNNFTGVIREYLANLLISK